MPKMKVAVFVEPGRIVLDEKSIPDVGPLDWFLAGLSDHTIRTTLCPGGKERMRRLMDALVSGRVDMRPLVTHRFKRDQVEEAYDLFAHQHDEGMKVAITP